MIHFCKIEQVWFSCPKDAKRRPGKIQIVEITDNFSPLHFKEVWESNWRKSKMRKMLQKKLAQNHILNPSLIPSEKVLKLLRFF